MLVIELILQNSILVRDDNYNVNCEIKLKSSMRNNVFIAKHINNSFIYKDT